MKRMKDISKSDMFSHWINIGYLPRWGVLLLDLLIVLIAFVVSYMIGSQILTYDLAARMPIWGQAIFVLVLQGVFFWAFHTYSGILRYSTFVDTLKVTAAVVANGLFLFLANLIVKYVTNYINPPFFTTVLVIYVFVAITLLFGWRVIIKTVFEYISHRSKGVDKVLIYGTKSAGLSIAKMLQSNLESQYRPVGFIADKYDDIQHDLLGLIVYPLNEQLMYTLKKHHIRHIIVSPLKMKQINPLVDLKPFIDNNIRILTTPYFTDFSIGENNDNINTIVGRIESIKVEDLLERPVIEMDTENVGTILEGQTVMVTGAAGSIGSEIVRQVAAFKPQTIVLFEMAESPLHDLTVDLRKEFPNQQFVPVIADVRNVDMVEEVFEEYHPHVVFHAAAYKHVPLMEDFPAQAILANVQGSKNVADMAIKFNAKRFVMVSTDKAVNPTNVMGASKRIAEIYVQSLFLKAAKENANCTKFITTRFGNVLGSNGSVVPYFKKQIAAGGPVTVTHPDIIRYFMTIPEASCLVLEAATLGNGGEIFCFDMGQPVKIADLAKNMIRLAGFEPGKDIEITYTGLRPGEKLYEELLNQKETTIPTKHKKILVAKVREYDYQEVAEQIEALIQLAKTGKVFPTVKLMKQIVPEFKSKNSVYEELDA
ncbi:MAG: polysaccharide biosynthesis protein [Paludibacteraceae bacterium]|nr:polysaccharide biosynthesis protein [Paludibacteraceae bacterium]